MQECNSHEAVVNSRPVKTHFSFEIKAQFERKYIYS